MLPHTIKDARRADTREHAGVARKDHNAGLREASADVITKIIVSVFGRGRGSDEKIFH